ncbi:MAG: hypothetical protein KatS3mg103_0662 [Phycisphaerales bacterium]|nr:MAG: hypothetical protein KatS3mg103_0662 [Phycisphaerales bacterium]
MTEADPSASRPGRLAGGTLRLVQVRADRNDLGIGQAGRLAEGSARRCRPALHGLHAPRA